MKIKILNMTKINIIFRSNYSTLKELVIGWILDLIYFKCHINVSKVIY